MKSIPLYFVAGFLGAGKTTVLNQLLGSLDGRTAGLIINEFGTIGIDAARIEGKQDQIFELNNGQIFCACLAGPLSSALVQLAERGPDLIFAECSGLSKPATLKEMVAGVARTTDGAVHYAGLITIIDGPRYPILRRSVAAVNEQVASAAAVILNKTDLMSPGEVESCEALIRTARPAIPVLRTQQGRVGFAEVEKLLLDDQGPGELSAEFMGWGDAGRPKSYALHPGKPVALDSLTSFLAEVSPCAYRIKGNLPGAEADYFQVDCVGDRVRVEARTGEPAVKGLVIIVPGDGKEEAWFRERFEKL